MKMSLRLRLCLCLCLFVYIHRCVSVTKTKLLTAASSCQNQNPLLSCKAEGPRWCWRLQWSRKWDISPFVLIPTKDLCRPVTGTSEIRLGRNFSIDDKDMTDYYHHWQFPSNFFAKIFEFAFCGFYKVRAQKKITEFFPAWGGGVFPIPKTFVNLPSFFGVPKSFWGAKTCFTLGRWWYLINLIT